MKHFKNSHAVLAILLLICGCLTFVSCAGTKAGIEPQESIANIPLDSSQSKEEETESPPNELEIMFLSSLFKLPLQVMDVSGEFELNANFSYTVQLAIPDKSIKPDALIGSKATLMMMSKKNYPVMFNGYITQISESRDGPQTLFVATLSPWTWLLSKTANLKIFHKKTIPEMVQEVFAKYNFADFEFRLKRHYPVEENFFQYRETDLNFVLRVLEDAGITTYFIHNNNSHTLIMTDSITGFSENDSVPVFESGNNESDNNMVLNAVNYQLTPAKYTLKSFDALSPGKKGMVGRAEAEKGNLNFTLEMFDYPGGYKDPQFANRFAALRLQEQRVERKTITGTTTAFDILNSPIFILKGYDGESQYLTIGYSLSISPVARGKFQMTCRFKAMPSSIPFTPGRRTPWPIIGVQYGVVANPDHGKNCVDSLGRVYVRFRWNNDNMKTSDYSAWFPVVQSPSGSSEGIHTLRLGDEVIVTFTDGERSDGLVTGKIHKSIVSPVKKLK